MIPFAPLATARLLLRPLRAEDAAALHRLVNDWDVAKNLAHVPFPYPRDLADGWIADTQERLDKGVGYSLAIEQDGALVGCAGLTLKGDEAELGYWIGRRFWGQGIAAEAAGRLATWALATLPLRRLHAQALPDNARSIAVLRRIGFQDDGEGEAEFVSRGGAMRVLRFVATRDSLPLPEAPAPVAEAAAASRILLVAACALIDTDGRVLLARRPEGKALAGLWEFPGGKVHPGETPEAALIRELHEELGIDVTEACLGPFTFASHAYPGFHLLMPLYLCRRWTGTVTGREGQALAWVRPQKLSDYPMPPADVPLVALLRDFL
ncbi:8-oxo-dGTP diphosphatase MutT [Humitalea sp. 24SJ18S-53]|uniref:8-oxo-dGTP diphosphatase MutT n=1 Tax=Humitalea sp. 24SJ18S-53 TaxID=3422307 RepID=UPI003D66FA12